MSGLRSALRFSVGASFAIQLLNVGTGVMLARALGPHGRGELVTVLLWPSVLAAFGGLGLVEATTYHVARRTVRPGALVGTVLVLALCQGIAVVGLGAVVLHFVLHNYNRETARAAYLFLAFAPLSMVALASMSILNGFRRYSAYQMFRVLTVVLIAVPIAGLTARGSLTVGRAVAAYVAANLIVAVAATVSARRACSDALAFERTSARDILSFGIRSHAGSVSSLLNERLDLMLISVFLAPVQLGLYAIAVTVTSVTSLVGASVSPIAAAQIAHLGKTEARATARRLVSFTFWASAALTLPIAVFAAPLINLFFGHAFASVARVAQLLLVAAIFLGTNRTLTAVLNGLGRPLDAAAAEGLALVSTIGLLAMLLPTIGLTGAGIASIVAYGLSGIWMLLRVSRALGVQPHALLIPPVGDGLRALTIRRSAVGAS